jgi:hypothetical protein
MEKKHKQPHFPKKKTNKNKMFEENKKKVNQKKIKK